MPTLPTFEHAYYALAIAAQLYFFAKWVSHRIDNYREMEKFMTAMRTNHLKHIYRNLKAICEKLDIEFDEPAEEE